MEKVFKARNNRGKGFEYLREKIRNVSDVKLKDGVFRLQIREIIKDHLSEHILTETEKSVWLTFKVGFLNFLRNLKAENYQELVEDLLKAYQTMGRNLSFIFTFALGHLSSEHGLSERRTWGSFPPRFFHHADKICRKMVTEIFS
jgi:hypothetical protein